LHTVSKASVKGIKAVMLLDQRNIFKSGNKMSKLAGNHLTTARSVMLPILPQHTVINVHSSVVLIFANSIPAGLKGLEEDQHDKQF